MAYLKRKIDDFLKRWKEDPDRLPLIIKGARQVGKTASIRHFAESVYKNVIEINFVEQPRFRSIVTESYEVDAIIQNITLIDPTLYIADGETLLFFDEIQDFPAIATALKFFAQDGRFDVICSGSMLGVNYQQIESNSVGYKIDYVMRSLDFEEYLWARGYDKTHTDSILATMVDLKPFTQTQYDVFHSLFLEYAVLGGMPAVVSSFVRKRTYERALNLQRQLIVDYQEDIQKYAEGVDKTRILNVFNAIPAQLARENKKFQMTKVAKKARFRDYRGCIEWLQTAGMIEICHNLSFPDLPLKGNFDPNAFKVYYADCGLLVAMLDDEASEDLRANKNLGVYKGALYENLAACAFLDQGLGLYYYKRDSSTLEEDFFARTRNHLVPIEVKAKGGRSKSLRTLIEDVRYDDIAFGVKFADKNVGFRNHVYTFPHFCLFQLRNFLATLD